MRKTINLNDSWLFKKTSDIPATLPCDYESINLPHTWNNKDGQDGGNDYWRGIAQYVKEFRKPELNDECLFLEVNGAAFTSVVYLNGEELTRHEGGYSTYRVDITDKVKDNNLLVISCDNSENDKVYPQKADFTFYGGLYRDVNLIITKNSHFELIKDGTPGIKVTPIVNLENKSAEVKVETWSIGGDKIEVEVCEKKECAEVKDGYATLTLKIEDVNLWQGRKDPYLYDLKVSLYENETKQDELNTKFGCRKIEFDPNKGCILNGIKTPLRGVSKHQDYIEVGNAINSDILKKDMKLIKEIGANTIRLAHYQHCQEFYDLCDKEGMLVWAEIPYITAHMSNGRDNTINQMKELITQCYNHPSIMCWGLSNEISASSPVDEDLLENHRILNDLCKKMDKTRPTTMAHAFMLEIDSPLIPIADLASYNLYFGWYLGELEQNESFFDEYHAKYPDRCIGFSEYGADANVKYQSENPEKGDYSETYQCVYHEHLLNCIENRDYLWATHVWNMFDFAADGREEGGKCGENQKGLVTFDRKTKKDAFYLYKAAWNKDEDFAHICGKRFENRCVDKLNIKVYSNQEELSLYVNGELKETKKANRVFNFEIDFTADTTIEVKNDKVSDNASFKRVEKEDESYSLGGKSTIINWFDKDTLKPGYFSIKDKFGELMAHPETSKIVGCLMQKMIASRGDVAKSANENPNLQKMLAVLSLESLFKQAGGAIPEEVIQKLNADLQEIKK